jgi:hypothetical protein
VLLFAISAHSFNGLRSKALLSRQGAQSLAFTEASASPQQPYIPSEFSEGVLLGVFFSFSLLFLYFTMVYM